MNSVNMRGKEEKSDQPASDVMKRLTYRSLTHLAQRDPPYALLTVFCRLEIVASIHQSQISCNPLPCRL